MAKKLFGSSARGKRAQKSERRTSGFKIDFSDIPELSHEQLAGMKRIGRPLLGASPRKMIAVRIDVDVLTQLREEAKRTGKGYQTLINEILSKHVKKKAA